MKKKFIVVLMLISVSIFALKNWQVYTNTTHIFDVIESENKIQIATWGGLVSYDTNTNSFGETLTTIDGLADNDIRSLDYLENSHQLLVGTAGSGINRIDESGFLTPLTETLGLQSDIINKITHNDSLIFVATKFGVSCFKDDPGFPFPLLLKNFNIDSGLSADDITSMQLTADGNIYFGSVAGVDYVHIDSMEVSTNWYHLNEGNSILPSNNVTSISIRNGKVAFGTDSGIFLSNDLNDPAQAVIVDEGLAIYPVYVDDQLNLLYSYGIWDLDRLVLTDTMDIAITMISDSEDITTWNKNESGLTTSKIKGFKEINGQIAAFTWGEGIFFFSENEWNTNVKANCISANLITDIEIDHNSTLWLSSGYYGLQQLGRGTKGVSSFDGNIWKNYTSEKYPGLRNNNVYDIAIDSSNRKWFSCWQFITPGNGGISTMSHGQDEFSFLTDFPSSYTAKLTPENNRMWISYMGGVAIAETVNNISISDTFQTEFDENQYNIMSLISDNYRFFGTLNKGVQYWDNDTDPVTSGQYWVYPPSSELRTGLIHALESRNIDGIEEIWVASGTGLFMFDGIDWFWFGTTIKKKVWFDNDWFWNEDNPDPEYWYYEGQERLYGSIPTYPTTLFVDPFGMIWIGTQDAGITIFDTSRDKFINLTTENTPLISNTITDFAYESITGTLYIGTSSGMNSVEIGISAEMNSEEELYETIVYPNPFYPENGDIVRIENKGSITMPMGDTFCRIYDLNGDFIMEIEKNIYEQFSWNGLNNYGKKCGSGIYYYVISAPNGQTSKGKIVLIR
ncbi:MAG: T9SS type A sorting domain-containing protein [Candidatus Cloacimonetes bacterium]|jgi:ligand-binding sensor domain-containing protein|nr:T9SS type A sorting domain-containing protein [Candidatus Cloacimonadota bacterium]